MIEVIDVFEVFVQYGLGGLALWMMYQITYNHLQSIQETLLEILLELKKREI